MINKTFKKLKIDNDEFLKKQNIDLSLRPEKLSENLFYKITEYYERIKLNKRHFFLFYDFQLFFQFD